MKPQYMPAPSVSDPLTLQIILNEHRRQLLEKLIREFPEVVKTKRSALELIRLQLLHVCIPS